MINHTVMFKLNDFATAEQKIEVRSKIKSLLLDLKNKIAELKYIEVGLNVELQSGSYDVCLITHFNNMEDLAVYRDHPEHLKVVDFIKANVCGRAVVDFEF